MKDSTNTPVRVVRTGISHIRGYYMIAETTKMELNKAYRIHFAGEDLVVVWTGKQLEIFEESS